MSLFKGISLRLCVQATLRLMTASRRSNTPASSELDSIRETRRQAAMRTTEGGEMENRQLCVSVMSL